MTATDPKAIDGKFAPIETEIELLVIGAGRAGCAAAIEAARRGVAVVLADENPLDPALMGMDVPLAFGGRMTGAVHNRARILEQIVRPDSAIAEAFDAGVDVRLATTVWGLFPPGPEARALPALVAGFADAQGCRMARCGRVVVAAGARDLMLGFAGCDQPGVIGAQALRALLRRYDASATRRMVVLGARAPALRLASEAIARGIEVATIVAPGAAPADAGDLPLLAGHVIRAARGGPDGVTAAILVETASGREQEVGCDTICLAIERVPNIELLAAAGCAMRFDPARGGWVPVLEQGRTTVPGISAVGGCAGLADNAGWHYAEAWFRALIETGGLDVPVCRCEAVTRADILGVRPPAYLGRRDGRIGGRDLASLLADGLPDPDQVKRLTRSGMGECQGRRCREQNAMLLAIGAGLAVEQIPLATYRAPVRPLPLRLLADECETEGMRAEWDSWFGIPTQWVPWWDIGTERDGIGRDAGLGDDWHL